MSWEEEFNAAMASFPQIVEEPVEYRMHYDETGTIIMLSHQNHPDHDLYLVVTKDEYSDYQHYSIDIKNKKLKKVVHNQGIRVQLKKSDHGYTVVEHHAGLLIEPGETYGNVEYYESNN